jgi:hypothetical protein
MCGKGFLIAAAVSLICIPHRGDRLRPSGDLSEHFDPFMRHQFWDRSFICLTSHIAELQHTYGLDAASSP